MNPSTSGRWALLAVAVVALAGCGAPEPRTPRAQVEEVPIDEESQAPSAPVVDPGPFSIVVPPGGGLNDLSPSLARFAANNGIPAVGAAVWRDQELVGLGAAGVRRLGDRTPVTTRDQWHLASDTKAMTATLVGMFVERGKIRYEDTIAALFERGSFHPGYANTTVDDLLHHRGGLPGGATPEWIQERMYDEGSEPGARSWMARAFLSIPPPQSPGTFEYSNAGYIVLGAALERISGKTWESLMQSELFDPLKMTSCGFGPPGHAGSVEQPWGHGGGQGRVRAIEPGIRADNPPAFGPAGTVHCSLEDWGKFLTMHMAGARGQATLVSAATMEHLHAPVATSAREGYAAGWALSPRPWNQPHNVLVHAGSNNSWFSLAQIGADRDMAFAVVANRGGPPMPKLVARLMAAIVQAYTRPSPQGGPSPS